MYWRVIMGHYSSWCITLSVLGETIKDLHSLIACLYMHLFLNSWHIYGRQTLFFDDKWSQILSFCIPQYDPSDHFLFTVCINLVKSVSMEVDVVIIEKIFGLEWYRRGHQKTSSSSAFNIVTSKTSVAGYFALVSYYRRDLRCPFRPICFLS